MYLTNAPQIPLDPAIATIRDGILAGLVMVLALAVAGVTLWRRGGDVNIGARNQVAVLVIALGGVVALGLLAYLQGQAVATFIGAIIGYTVGARPEVRARKEAQPVSSEPAVDTP